jgi:16S rRNA (cytidine1402-2'-O)-methyltransferase
MAGILYVVGAPAGFASDLTRRAIRILGEVDLVVTDDRVHARRLLDLHGITTDVVSAGSASALDTLEAGDLALISASWSPGLEGPGSQLVGSAIERGFSVVSVPGPCLPLTALVISGLPADSFVHLGELPQRQPARGELLASLAFEPRTLVVTTAYHRLAATLRDLQVALGERPAVLVSTSETASGKGTEVLWRGILGESPAAAKDGDAGSDTTLPDSGPAPPPLDPSLAGRTLAPLILVVGGALERIARWDEGRLVAEILALRQQGQGASQIGRQLAARAGWSRREIYRRAVKAGQPGAAPEGASQAESRPE